VVGGGGGWGVGGFGGCGGGGVGFLGVVGGGWFGFVKSLMKDASLQTRETERRS